MNMLKITARTIASSSTRYHLDHRKGSSVYLENLRLFLEYFSLALMFRLLLLGNPLVHVDEEFYLLVADRWAHGALPFVDIWDRKPLGLFLLYRLFHSLPGDPVLTYQLCGIASTAAAALVRALALELAPARGAWLAGLVYICAMPAFNCALGQSPVSTTRWWPWRRCCCCAWQRADAANLLREGSAIMLLIGLALQIKYAAVFEGWPWA
jgi:hypothetical protein